MCENRCVCVCVCGWGEQDTFSVGSKPEAELEDDRTERSTGRRLRAEEDEKHVGILRSLQR